MTPQETAVVKKAKQKISETLTALKKERVSSGGLAYAIGLLDALIEQGNGNEE
jgi:hypothetical protein